MGNIENRFKLSSKQFLLTVPRRCFFCGSIMFFSVLCLLCLCARLFICALWPPAGKGLTSWLSFAVFNWEFVTFPIDILGQVWYLIGPIPDLCTLTYLFQCICMGNIENMLLQKHGGKIQYTPTRYLNYNETMK